MILNGKGDITGWGGHGHNPFPFLFTGQSNIYSSLFLNTYFFSFFFVCLVCVYFVVSVYIV